MALQQSGSMNLDAFRSLAKQGHFKAVVSSVDAVEVSSVSDEVERDCILAWAFSRLGDQDRAVSLAQAAYDKAVLSLGSSDPVTLLALNDLARFRFRAGDVKEGLRLGEEVLDLRLRVLGEDDPKTLVSAANVLRYRFDSGEHVPVEELEDLVARWLVIDPARRDPAHLSAALLRADVMQAYALAARRDVVAWYVSALGEEHPDTVRAQV